MKLTEIFIKRPVLSVCVNLLILIAGIYSLFNLSVRQYPKSDVSVVKVSTAYVGADADLIRGFITTPLERAIASADGIDYLESASRQGMSEILAHLRLNYDINDALTQVQAKVAQVRNELPPEAEAPVINVESNDNRIASMYLSFYSDELESNQITDFLTRVVQPKLAAVSGVQKADIIGARTFAMRIWLKSNEMAALNVSPIEVSQALENNNFLSAVGSAKGGLITVNLTANTDLTSKEEFENLIIRKDGNSILRLKDIADVNLGAESYDEDVKFDGQTATFMGIWVLPNANALTVIKNIRKALPDIQARVPSGLKVSVAYDATAYISDSIYEVVKTLSETVIIVILVIFLFIGSFRGVLVPVVAIPLSLIGVLTIMVAMGFTVNLLTLLAIVLAVGLVVDDAIVVLENVEHHIQKGKSPIEAALICGQELTTPIIAMTITLAAVYTPIALQGGLSGALFREFAFTLSGAVFISGIVALTLSPMMSSQLLRANEDPTTLKIWIEDTLLRLRNWYGKVLTKILSLKALVGSASISLMAGIPLLYMFSMSELAPREDQGVLFGIVQAAPQSSIEQTAMYASEIQNRFTSFPEYRQSFQLTNPTGGFSGILLKPFSERDRTVQEIEGEAWGKMASVPGVRVIVTTPPPLPGGSDFPVELVIASTSDPKEIVQYANQLVGRAYASGLFMFADSDLKYDLPQSELIIDREKVGAMGMTLRQVGTELGIMTGGNYVNRFNIDGRSYKVIPQAKRADRLTPEQLTDVYIRGPEARLIPASTVARVVDKVEARQLNRFQQLNSAKIQGAPVPGASIDHALKVLENAAAEILPGGYSLDYAGESRQLRKEQKSMGGTLFLAMIVIFLVLAAQFESFRDPFVILAGSVPLALAGALIFVFLGFTSLNVYSQVGLVTLVGLVSKNGILIVEFANHLKEQGKTKLEAIIEAAQGRLRPVLMTSVATVVGHFPLLLAEGAGAGARNSIGAVLVTGMIIGTTFTLFVLPVIYMFVSAESKDGNSTNP